MPERPPTKDLYAALEVPHDATSDAIKDAWRRIAKASHPDRNPNDAEAVARFVRASEAYEVLADPARRQSYDLALRTPRRTPRPWDDDIVWAPRGGAPRRGVRRTVHAPGPSDRDVQAVRSGVKNDGSALMVVFGVIGVGPIALIFAMVAATAAGPLPFLGFAAALALYALVKLRGQPDAQGSALAVAVILALGAAFAVAQHAGLVEHP